MSVTNPTELVKFSFRRKGSCSLTDNVLTHLLIGPGATLSAVGIETCFGETAGFPYIILWALCWKIYQGLTI